MQNIVWIFIAILGGLVVGFFIFGKKKEDSENKNEKEIGFNFIFL